MARCHPSAIASSRPSSAKVKEKLEIDPLHADTVRLIYRLALEGDGTTGQMGIVSYLNRNRRFTRDGGRWGIGQVHRILTRRTYMGEHEFNKRSKSKELKPVSEIVVVPVPPIIDRETSSVSQSDRTGQIPRCFAIKPNFTSTPWQSRPRLFLECHAQPSAC